MRALRAAGADVVAVDQASAAGREVLRRAASQRRNPPGHIMVVEEDEQLDPYPIIDTDDERRPLSPRPGRCRVHSSPAKSRKMQSGLREQPAAPEF